MLAENATASAHNLTILHFRDMLLIMSQTLRKLSQYSPVERVQKINFTWLVKDDLRTHANEYIEHLAQHDPERLELACEAALLLLQQHGDSQDPKPLFYAGLFSHSTQAERLQFIREHAFTRAILYYYDHPFLIPPTPEKQSHIQKLARLILDTLNEY